MKLTAAMLLRLTAPLTSAELLALWRSDLKNSKAQVKRPGSGQVNPPELEREQRDGTTADW